jgi:hypothetical protein
VKRNVGGFQHVSKGLKSNTANKYFYFISSNDTAETGKGWSGVFVMLRKIPGQESKRNMY